MNDSTNIIKGTTLTLLQFSLLLIVSSAMVRLASSLYLPSLINIGRTMHLSDAVLASTLTIYFIAFACSTLFAGPLADRYGRKNVILTGCVIFIIGSLLCATAYSITALLAGRVLQAAGASCIPVAGRAMIRDLCSDAQVISVLGWLAAIGGLIPIIAPMLGGIITDTLGWRYNFWFLVSCSIIAVIIIGMKLPRSIKPEKIHRLNLGNILGNYKEMLISPAFILVITPLALAFAIQGAYLASSPFIFIKQFGLTPLQFGFANLAVVASLIAGRYIASGLVRNVSIYAAYMTGAVLPFVGGGILFLIDRADMANLVTVLIPLSVAIIGFGTMLPVGVKSIMTAFRGRAGTVSALHGCFTLGMASVGCFAVSKVREKLMLSFISSMALFTVVTGLLIIAAAFFSRKHLQ